MVLLRTSALVLLLVVSSALSWAGEIWRPRPDLAPRFDFSGYEIRSLAASPDGKIYLWGNVAYADGAQTLTAGLVRLNADGTSDPTFAPNLDLGQSWRVRAAMAVQPDGKLLLALPPPPSSTTTSVRLLRFLNDGTLDSSFRPDGEFDGAVDTIATQPDGAIIVIGRFTHVGASLRRGLARLRANGALDVSFDPETFLAGGTLQAAAAGSDGRMVVAIASTNTVGPKNYWLLRLRADGSVDPTFVSGTGGDDRFDALAVMPDGRVLGIGSFSPQDGQNGRGTIRLEATGAVDPSYWAGPRLHFSASGSNSLRIALMPDGAMLVLGGGYYYHDNTQTLGIARVAAFGALDTDFWKNLVADAASVDALPLSDGKFLSADPTRKALFRFSASGVIDPAFAPNLGSPGTVTSVVPLSGGRWMIGGSFNRVNGLPRAGVVRLNANWTVDSSFVPEPGFAPTTAIGVQSDGKILHGGSYVEIGRMTESGANDPSFARTYVWAEQPHSYGANITTFEPLSDGRMIMGGEFIRGFYGQALAVINSSDGTFSNSFDCRAFIGRKCEAIAVLLDGKLLVAARTALFDPYDRGIVRRINPDGSVDSGFVFEDQPAGFLGDYHSLAVLDSGKIIVGGSIAPGTFAFPIGDSAQPTLRRVTANGATEMSVTLPGFGRVKSVLGRPDGGAIAAINRPDGSGAIVHVNGDGSSDSQFVIAGAKTLRDPRVLKALPGGGMLVAGGSMKFAGFTARGLLVLEPAVGPQVTLEPRSRAIAVGNAVTLTAEGDGLTPVTYQWRRNGIAIAGATSASYTLPSAQLFDSGDYTVVVSDATGSTTSSLATLTVSASPSAAARVLNLSTRGFVGAGASVMIPGVVISSEGPKTLLIRAVGPTLASFGVSGALADPFLTIFASDGTALFTNDDWETNPTAPQTALAATQVSAFPLPAGSKDAALVVTLQPGAYTVQISGASGATGVALAEVYVVP